MRLFLLIILFIGFPIQAQDLKVLDVQFQSDGDCVVVHYHLEGNLKKRYHIDLWLSCDEGNTFTIHPKHVSGDVGYNVRPGHNKEITWEIKKDFPYGLVGETYVFAVDAEIQKRWRNLKYYVIGGAAIAGSIYLYSQRGKGNCLKVTVPGEY